MVSGTISDNMIQKPLFYVIFCGQMPLRYSFAMATPEIPGDQKLFEKGVLYFETKSHNV